MNKLYNIVKTEKTELGRFAIRLDTIEKNGSEYHYSFIEARDSVAVLAKADDKFVLIRQYRHSVGKNVLEIPGGALEIGEDSMEAAKRELLEETGYRTESIMYLGSFYPSIGSSYERCYLYYVECGKKVTQKLDPLEYLTVELTDAENFEKKIIEGEFVHSMGLVAWLKYRLMDETTYADRTD